jgi:hypothetical protein
MTIAEPRKAKLITVGLVLLAVSLFLPVPFTHWANRATTDSARLAFAILADTFRACFFVALACLIIGALRNRRWRKEAERARSQGT